MKFTVIAAALLAVVPMVGMAQVAREGTISIGGPIIDQGQDHATTSIGSEACAPCSSDMPMIAVGNPSPAPTSTLPPAWAYANYTRGQIESSTTLIEATSIQLADCRSEQKDQHLEQARLLVGSMQRTQQNAGATEAGFREVSLYQDAVVSNLGRAMQACAPSTPPFAYLIRDRIKVTAALVDAAAACPEDRNLTNARRHLDRMRRIADGNEATERTLAEVSTEQNHAMARVAKALQTCPQ